MASNLPNISNEVVMEALRIKGEVILSDANLVTEDDITKNLELVDGTIDGDIVRRQTVLVALAFAYPKATQPEE